MKIDINKALITAEVLAWTFIVTTFALNLFGFEVVDTTISNPYILQFVRFVEGNTTIRFITNCVIGTGVITLMYFTAISNYSHHKYFILFSIITPITQIFINILRVAEVSQIIIFFVSLSIYFIPILATKSLKTSFKILFLDNAIVVISVLIVGYSDLFLDFILISINYVGLWFLYYIKSRRVKKWQLYLELAQDFLKKKLTQLKTLPTNMQWHMRKALTKMKKHGLLNALVQLMKESRFYIRHALIHKFKRKVLPHVIVYGLYLGYAVVVDKVLQAVFLYVAYVCFYRLFPKHFHADYIPGIKKNWITRTCICLSALMLCTALHNVIGGGLSVMSSIVVAFVIDWILYVIRDWLDFNLRYETDFTKYGLSIEMSNFAYDWKVTGLRDKELMIKYEINSVNTLNSRKRRIKQAMHTK